MSETIQHPARFPSSRQLETTVQTIRSNQLNGTSLGNTRFFMKCSSSFLFQIFAENCRYTSALELSFADLALTCSSNQIFTYKKFEVFPKHASFSSKFLEALAIIFLDSTSKSAADIAWPMTNSFYACDLQLSDVQGYYNGIGGE